MIVISSCITGIKCRYNASSSYNKKFLGSIKESYIDICPEILAGLKIPRKPCEITGGSGEDVLNGNAKIMDNEGFDMTDQMIAGAKKAIKICLENKVTKAYLQSKSPTCGYGKIYNGTFSSTIREGNGIFTALLIKNKIKVFEIE